MNKYETPILTDEYKIVTVIGTKKELISFAKKYIDKDSDIYNLIEDKINGNRGTAFDTLYQCGTHPLILINGDWPADSAFATLAHEACHAMDFIIDYVGIDDRHGEFRAHGIGAVLRGCNLIAKKKKKK